MEQTIAAISTGMTEAGIGIVRMSGVNAVEIADKIYRGKHGKLKEQKSHTIHYGFIYEDDKMIDQVLVMLMKAPYTYTGEDVVEINCHGGMYIVKKVLNTVLRAGAVLAQPGEFTKRAFLNGKMDLTQAEAVSDVISSKNEFALSASLNQLKGKEKKKIIDIRNKIIYHTAFIETALDDPEHISLDGYKEKIKKEIKTLIKEIEELLRSSKNGIILKEGLQTAILGKPNAGKSSLMNALSRSQKAIVTEIAGTTRDVLEEEIQLDGITLHIADTAGIRDTKDYVEKIGVERAIEYGQKADLVLYVLDVSRKLDEDDAQVLSLLKDKKVIVILNKTDLDPVIKKHDVEEFLSGYKEYQFLNIIEISAKEETGIEQLSEAISNLFLTKEISYNDEIYITSIRHQEAFMGARDSLKKVLDSIEMDMPEDFYTIDLMDGYEKLGSIIGEEIGEDLVNEIFSKFCMGK